MSFITSKKMLLDAQKGNYAIGAFNVENMEMILAVIEAAEEMKAPVILQTTPSAVRYAGLNLYYGMVCAAAGKASIPVALHLDHGSSFNLAMQALRVGYTSIMIDGSQEPLRKNADLARAVAAACHPSRIPVEAELGQVGGKEGGLEGGDGGLTSPDEAAWFADETGIDSLAVSIGTAHGVYSGVPDIRVDLLREIKKRVTIPLVLHGTSGISDDTVRLCIQEGICKVNYATDLRIAYSRGVKEVFHENSFAFDPKGYGRKGKELVKLCVMDRIAVCGSAGKA